jgi:uncharacterized membrane protein YdjX (TVP38/TMEM64 family)
VLTLRFFPLAPFALVNVFVGAWGIRFWEFFMASIVGRIPGIILLTLAGVQVESLLRQPGLIGVVLLWLILMLVLLALSRLSKRLLSGDRRQPDSSKSLSGGLLLAHSSKGLANSPLNEFLMLSNC